VDAPVAWPPPEAAPAGESAKATTNGAPAAGDSGVMTAPEASPAAKAPAPAQGEMPEMPAAEPQEEMGLSNSTLHWLEDGEQAVPSRLTEPGTMPSYDPRAPVAGRRRAVLVVGGAGLVALITAGYLYAQTVKHRAEQPTAPAVVEPARDRTNKAEAALAANRLDEALDFAHLALGADQRFADAHFVLAAVQQARNQSAAARDEYRKYLELAPLGVHSQAARAALSTLPP
jgi:tetratricopeptide (TPR) repeat protein